MDLRVFVQLDNRIDNLSIDYASSALMHGPFVTWSSHREFMFLAKSSFKESSSLCITFFRCDV